MTSKGPLNIREYTKTWQMILNLDKRKIMHPEKNNLYCVYRMRKVELEITSQVRDS